MCPYSTAFFTDVILHSTPAITTPLPTPIRYPPLPPPLSHPLPAPSPAPTRSVDGRGAAEGVRLLLAAGNKWDRVLDRRWPIDMTKVRDGIAVACPLFDQAIKDGELRMNMNRIPVLIHTDPETGVARQVGQSSAMER